jgi:hypothetical protein
MDNQIAYHSKFHLIFSAGRIRFTKRSKSDVWAKQESKGKTDNPHGKGCQEADQKRLDSQLLQVRKARPQTHACHGHSKEFPSPIAHLLHKIFPLLCIQEDHLFTFL